MALGGHFDPGFMGKLLISVEVMQLLALYANTRKLREDTKMGPVFRTWALSGPGTPLNQFQRLLTCFLTKKHGPWGSF